MAWADSPSNSKGPGYGPQPVVRFSAINDAWDLFLRRWGTWTLAVLIVLVCQGAVLSFVLALFHAGNAGPAAAFRLGLPRGGSALQIILSSIVNGFFVGGMFRMACRQARGEEIAVADLFSIIDVLPELILGSVFYALATSVAAFFFVIPGFIVAGLLMFTIPLVVDARLPATTAASQSWNALKSQWLTVTIFHLVVSILSGLGFCLCCAGLLLTAPLYTLSIAVLYRDFFFGTPASDAEKPLPSFSEF